MIFANPAQIGVLVVIECDHRVTLLEPFNIMHKGKFAPITRFQRRDALTSRHVFYISALQQ
jgi:hypothetical protein